MSSIRSNMLPLVGAVVGGALGYFIFFWLTEIGLYALVVPGGLLGMGAGWFTRRSLWIGILCAIAALFLGLFTEWRFAPFVADGSFGYFLTHIHELRPMTLVMIAAGAVLGFLSPARDCFSKSAS